MPPIRSYNVSHSFADLGVPARLVEALAADGITEPFPVQAITLPDALAGKDLCGRAPTGSGKTLGFGIPMMVRISQAAPHKPTGLVLVPTRELAEQVQKVFVTLGRAQWRFVQAIYGGASFGPQIHSLRKGASVIVATPGRLIDIIDKGYCDLSAVEVCVIDEADRMADLGFMPDVRKILDMTPTTRQTMLWSATLDGDVQEIIRDYMKDPVRHDLMEDVEQAPVDHRFVVTRPSERLDAAVALIEEYGPTVVFVKTRYGVDDVSEDLNRAGVKAGALHGARSQAVRQRTLDDFKRGKIQALVATDVAARGIHVDNVSLVLHYDMPDNDKDYTHRSGRTGRAGAAGVVVAFVPPSRQRIAQRMSDNVNAEVIWEQGEKPVERVPAGERETGNRDRGERERGGYSGRGDRNADRGSYSDRGSRGGYSDRNADRGSRGGGYGDRSDRPSYNDRPSSDRPSYADRSERGGYAGRGDASAARERPASGADRGGYRGARADGPGRDRNDWSPRPPRSDAPSRDRNDWSPRPRRDDDRSNERGRVNRDDRPRFSAERTDDHRPGAHRPTGDRPNFARDGQRPPYGRDGNSDRPWRNRDEAASERPRYGDDRSSTPRSDARPGRPGYGAAPGTGGGYKGRSDRPGGYPGGSAGTGGGYKGRSDKPAYGGSDRPAYGSGKPSYGSGKPGYGSGKPAGGYKSAGSRSGGFKPGGYKPGPASADKRRPQGD